MLSVLRSMDVPDETVLEKPVSAFNLTRGEAERYMSSVKSN